MPIRQTFPTGLSCAAIGAAKRLMARTTASPIRRMGTSVGDGWRESSRPETIGDLISRVGRVGRARLLDDLIRPQQHRLWDRQADRLGGFEIDDQLELRRLLHGQISRTSALENP